jgi:hypothetical protein
MQFLLFCEDELGVTVYVLFPFLVDWTIALFPTTSPCCPAAPLRNDSSLRSDIVPIENVSVKSLPAHVYILSILTHTGIVHHIASSAIAPMTFTANRTFY